MNRIEAVKAALNKNRGEDAQRPVEPVVMAQKPSEAAKKLSDYWATYNNQPSVDDYTLSIFIDDALYGLGIALNPELFKCGNGYDKFKKVLRKHLEP